MVKWGVLVLVIVWGMSTVVPQEDSAQEHLRKAIALYQIMDFEGSLKSFDKALTLDSGNVSIIGRRGYVCARYIMAVDEGKVKPIPDKRYQEVVAEGIGNLETCLATYPNHAENQRSLNYLKSRVTEDQY